jgi:hypothetical protein
MVLSSQIGWDKSDIWSDLLNEKKAKGKIKEILGLKFRFKVFRGVSKFSLVASSRATLSKFYVRLFKGYRLATATAIFVDPS